MIVAGWAWDDRMLAVLNLTTTQNAVLFVVAWLLSLLAIGSVAEWRDRRRRRRIDRSHLRVRPVGRGRDAA